MLLSSRCLDSPAKLCTVTCVSFLPAGNLILDPQAALLFIDFTTGDTLHLSGRAEVHWDQVDLPGAQRTIIFQTEEWVHVKGALPIKQQGQVESSPYNPTPPSKPGKLKYGHAVISCQCSLDGHTEHNSMLKLDAWILPPDCGLAATMCASMCVCVHACMYVKYPIVVTACTDSGSGPLHLKHKHMIACKSCCL